MMSKAITAAPSLAKFSVKRACKERGHFSGSVGRLRLSAETLSMATTRTSEGGFRGPLSLNSKPMPMSSSRPSPGGKRLTPSPNIPVSKPTVIALGRRDIDRSSSWAWRPLIDGFTFRFCSYYHKSAKKKNFVLGSFRKS